MPIIFKNKKYKEIFCKNDNCRKLMGYELVRKGELIFVCPKCEYTSHYNISRGEGQVIMEQLQNDDLEYNIDINKFPKKEGERNG